MACRTSSNRAFSTHLASDGDEFLKEELDGMIETAVAQDFLRFALPDLKGTDSLDTPEWKTFTDQIDANEEQRKLKHQWIAVQPENQKYAPFCDWVDNLLTSIDSFIESQSSTHRQIRFTSLGSTNICCTQGYADGEKVNDPETSFRPEAACVMKNLTQLDGWCEVLLPVEFKRRRDARRSMTATPSASTSELRGPGASRGSSQRQKRSHPNDSTSGSNPNKSRRVGSSSSHQPSSRQPSSSQPSSSQSPFSQPTFSQPSSARALPVPKQPDHSTDGSYPNNVWCHETFNHRSKTTVESPTPATPCTPPVYKATKDDIQLARYAMETLAAVGDRTHVFGLAVNSNNDNANANDNEPDHTIALWYFDRCGAIRSHPLDVNNADDLGAFIKFLVALVCMTDDALGFNPFFPADAAHAKPVPGLCGMSVWDNKDQQLELQKVLDRRTGMVGRATLVHRARLHEKSTPEPVDVVLKSSWQHAHRESEWDILEELNPDGKAENIVKCYGGWEQKDTGGSSQRARFGLTNVVVHDRVLRHTVLEYLNPITQLSGPFHVPHIGWSILNAIGFLNEKKWFHRDISIGNMGFVTLPECGGVQVKLHDFDLSKRHNADQDNPHWTGTLPFVAIGLLECHNAKNRIGFDVEALIWTLLWIVRVHGDETAVDICTHPLKRWFDDPTDLRKIADSKKGHLSNPPGDSFTNLFYREHEIDMTDLASKWHEKLHDQGKERTRQNMQARALALTQLAPSPTQEQVEKMFREILEEKRGGEAVYLLDKVYGEPSFTFLQGWMKEKKWHEPKHRCSCSEAHCAQLEPEKIVG